MNIIRFFDISFSFIGLVVLSPIIVIIIILIKLSSRGSAFFLQSRVAKGGSDFNVYKFRTMYVGSDKKGLLTVGGKDNRITPVGIYLRKYKLDELPQLLNVLKGEMSIVGPRPEVRKYVNLYTDDQKKVLSVLPGITDFASIAYRNENELLAKAEDPERFYINEIIPRKIALNIKFIENRSIKVYFSIILKTFITAVVGK